MPKCEKMTIFIKIICINAIFVVSLYRILEKVHFLACSEPYRSVVFLVNRWGKL